MYRNSKIALYGMKYTEALDDILPIFFQRLKQYKVEIQIEKEFLDILESNLDLELSHLSTFLTSKDLWEDLDLFFTFGGDGTILSAVTIVQDSQIPIVGINTGRLGYLAGINKNELLDNLEDIISGNFKISRRSLVGVSVSGTKLEYPFALNEITILRTDTTSMITIEAYVNGELINSFWGDGLIISTPTGSTGYSLSCNGPIISPETDNFVITPMAPHNLNVRPLVMSNSEVIKLVVHSRVEQYSMSLDSRLESLSTEQTLTVGKADFKVNIVQLNDSSYFQTLRKKLYWGLDKRN